MVKFREVSEPVMLQAQMRLLRVVSRAARELKARVE
jgi:hypothetical protein